MDENKKQYLSDIWLERLKIFKEVESLDEEYNKMANIAEATVSRFKHNLAPDDIYNVEAVLAEAKAGLLETQRDLLNAGAYQLFMEAVQAVCDPEIYIIPSLINPSTLFDYPFITQ